MKIITKNDLPYLATGAAWLGSGGGGNPSTELLAAQYQLEQFGSVTLIDVATLSKDDFVVPIGFIGSPSVCIEKVPSGKELKAILEQIELYYGKKPTALMPVEIGGSNAFAPFLIAGQLELPVVDGDGLGRAFPEIQMCSFNLHNITTSPVFLSDEFGNTVTVKTIENNALTAEKVARHVTVAFGSNAGISMYLMDGLQAQKAIIKNSISKAIMIGKTIDTNTANDPIEKLLTIMPGKIIGSGIIEDINDSTDRGFLEGTVTIIDNEKNVFYIRYQNEYLFANQSANGNSKLIATTPDIITIADTQTGKAITSESLMYGLRVTIVALPAEPMWQTAEGLKLVGPKAFGKNINYKPILKT